MGTSREDVMKIGRRKFLEVATGAVALPAISRIARAQAYPTRPVRIVVGFPAGSINDILARLMGQWLSERLGQPFIVENRPGAAGNIGTEVVVRAPPDAYTLLLVSPANAISTTLYDKLNFNFIRDVAPIASIMRVANVIVVNPAFPANTVPEFIAYAKANPGKINMASGGNGGAAHVSGELFNMMAGVNMVHVPYRGTAAALADLLSGRVQVIFNNMPNSIEYIRTGQLKPLAVTTITRLQELSNIPTVDEFVPGYETSAWYGIGVPKSTPAEIVELLNKEVNLGLADPKIKARLADLGGTVLSGSPADFGKLVRDETEKWGKVIRAANIKPE
jgi:tripartite-type tricarboxylate transporter receptor subunit TctC